MGYNRTLLNKVHLIFVDKCRLNVCSNLAILDLRNIFDHVCNTFEAQLIACNGEDDQVYLLVNYSLKICRSQLVSSMKGVSCQRFLDVST